MEGKFNNAVRSPSGDADRSADVAALGTSGRKSAVGADDGLSRVGTNAVRAMTTSKITKREP